MTVKAIIVDDEQNNIENLAILLARNCPGIEVIATSLNADDAERHIISLHPDIVFLDIQMSGRTGFDLLKSIPNSGFEIIFVTGFDKYALQAIKFSAADYLLKPINVADLKIAVQKASARIVNRKENIQLQNLIALLKNEYDKTAHRIALTTQKETRFVLTSSIVRCESSNNYTTFYLNNKEKLIVSKPIYEYEELLSSYGFIRCHQSHLINKSFIKSWVKTDGGYLLLEEGSHIPVSKNKRSEIKEMIEYGKNF